MVSCHRIRVAFLVYPQSFFPYPLLGDRFADSLLAEELNADPITFQPLTCLSVAKLRG